MSQDMIIFDPGFQTPEVLDWQAVVFGVLAIVCFAVSILSSYRYWMNSVFASGLMVTYWCTNNFFVIFKGEDMYLLTDTLFAVIAFIVFPVRTERWLMVQFLLYGLVIPLDVLQLHRDISLMTYAIIADAIFFIQVFLASWNGWHKVGRMIVDMKRRMFPQKQRLLTAPL